MAAIGALFKGCTGNLLIGKVNELFSLLLSRKLIRSRYRFASGSYGVGSVSEGFNFVTAGAAILINFNVLRKGFGRVYSLLSNFCEPENL